jgi:hypothetical protein
MRCTACGAELILAGVVPDDGAGRPSGAPRVCSAKDCTGLMFAAALPCLPARVGPFVRKNASPGDLFEYLLLIMLWIKSNSNGRIHRCYFRALQRLESQAPGSLDVDRKRRVSRLGA